MNPIQKPTEGERISQEELNKKISKMYKKQ